MFRFVVSKKYIKILKSINSSKKKNILQLSKESGMTNSHVSIVMNQWLKEDLIIKTKKGREFEIALTEKGKLQLNLLEKIIENQKEVKNENRKPNNI